MSQPAASARNSEVSAPAVIAVRPGTSGAADPGTVEEHAAARGARPPWTRPLWIIALCALAVVMRLGRQAFIPLALAMLVAFILSSPVEALKRLRVPRALSAAVLLLLLAGLMAGALDLVITPAQQWMQNAPRTLRLIEHRIRPAQSVLRRVDDIAQRAQALATSGSSAPPPDSAQAPPANAPSTLTALDVFTVTGWAAVGIVTVLAFSFLLLASSPATLARMVFGDGQTTQTLQILDAIRSQVGRYYGTLLLLNLVFGTVVGGLMWLLGMPTPALWGVLAGVLHFVPYMGAAITLVILTIVALVTFSSTAHLLLVAACYLGLATVEAYIVEPVFLGRRLDLSPILVLFALWTGGWLWGVAGMVLALPVLLATRVAARMIGEQPG